MSWNANFVAETPAAAEQHLNEAEPHIPSEVKAAIVTAITGMSAPSHIPNAHLHIRTEGHLDKSYGGRAEFNISWAGVKKEAASS